MTGVVYLGIDPGVSGGIAHIGIDGVTSAFPMPPTDERTYCLIKKLASTGEARGDFGGDIRPDETMAAIEKVGGYLPGRGGNIGSAMFQFGVSYGSLRMALVAATIPFVEIAPRSWQSSLGIPPRTSSESRVEWKNRLKAMAARLFPSVKVTLATADALLIVEWCRRRNEGELTCQRSL